MSEEKDRADNAKKRNWKKQTMTLKGKTKIPANKNADKGQTYRQL